MQNGTAFFNKYKKKYKNIRYNNFYTANKLKRKIRLVVKNICKINKCKFKIKFIANGDSFLTKPNKTIFIAKKNFYFNSKKHVFTGKINLYIPYPTILYISY